MIQVGIEALANWGILSVLMFTTILPSLFLLDRPKAAFFVLVYVASLVVRFVLGAVSLMFLDARLVVASIILVLGIEMLVIMIRPYVGLGSSGRGLAA